MVRQARHERININQKYYNVTTMKKRQQQLKNRIDRQVQRMKQAEQDRPNLLSQTIYLGTLGLVMVLPIVAGAYLGHWLDSWATASINWMLCLLLTGVVIGFFNVYFLLKNK
jgi:ATP synthase protein I